MSKIVITDPELEAVKQLLDKYEIAYTVVDEEANWKSVQDSFNELRKTVNQRALTINFGPAVKKRIGLWFKEGFTIEDFDAVHRHYAAMIKRGEFSYKVENFNPNTLYKIGKEGIGFETRVMLARDYLDTVIDTTDDLYADL